MAVKDPKILLKEIDLQNNCPECFSQVGLRLRFYQRFHQNLFFKRLTNEVNNVMDCQKCGSTIYPVQWTEDIERVHEYYTKLVKPRKTSFKLTKWGYVLVFADVLLVVGLVLYFTGNLPF